MKNKFAHLGRVLTREEAKLIVGGLSDGGSYWACSCVGGTSNGNVAVFNSGASDNYVYNHADSACNDYPLKSPADYSTPYCTKYNQ